MRQKKEEPKKNYFCRQSGEDDGGLRKKNNYFFNCFLNSLFVNKNETLNMNIARVSPSSLVLIL